MKYSAGNSEIDLSHHNPSVLFMAKDDLYLKDQKNRIKIHPSHSKNPKMDYQNAQQYSKRAVPQKSELNPLLLRDFLDQEAQNVFSYVPDHQISHMLPHSSYDSILMENALEGYTWPAQGSELNHAATDPEALLQVQTSAQLQSAVADYTSDDQGFRQVGRSFEDKLTLLEDRISGLELVIQDLRSE